MSAKTAVRVPLSWQRTAEVESQLWMTKRTKRLPPVGMS